MTTRRDALRHLGVLAALPALPVLSRVDVERLIALGHRALTPAQYRVVELAAERIIPRTKTPGATDVHVADFVDVMMADWYTAPERERFLAGVDDLATAGFEKAPESRQTAMLDQLDAHGDASWFSTLKHLTVWGYCTSQPGLVQELRVELFPGHYDGNAPA